MRALLASALLPPILLGAALGLGACAPIVVHPARTPALDFGGPAPDVVVLAVSGRCGAGCVAPRDNWDYLTARGTVDRVADAIAAAGYRVEVAGYASGAQETFTSRRTGTVQRGYPALVADYARLGTAWGGRRPRVVLLGHSQGVAWLHHLARAYPEQPVALQIDLDGICAGWHTDHGAAIRALPRDPVRPSPDQACDLFRVASRSLRGKDVVWPHVARNLEVQSKRLPARTGDSGGLLVNYLFEVTPNARLDGSLTGIERYVSPREDHSAVSSPQSDALRWVVSRLGPVVQEWRREDKARADQG